MAEWKPAPYKDYRWIVADPELLGGKLAVRGTRLSVALILECLSNGMTLDDIDQAFGAAFPHEALPEVLKVASELADAAKGISSPRPTFWAAIRHLRVRSPIPRQWRIKDVRPHLLSLGFAHNAITTIPPNQSVTRDGKLKGDYVKRGQEPKAYRVGRGLYELIDDPSGAPCAPSAPPTDSSSEDAAQKLARVARLLATKHRSRLEELKARESQYLAEDFIWEALLRSFATMGNSRGKMLTENPAIHKRVRWEAVVPLTDKARRRILAAALRQAKVRMPSRKTEWLLANFDRIQADGGLLAVKEELEARAGKGAKIRFLETFRGISDKYARNIMMNVYHPEFRDSIAIDVRVKKIAEKLGIPSSPYAQAEGFFLSVAREAGLNGWELDRLLYEYNDEALAALSREEQQRPQAARKGSSARCR